MKRGLRILLALLATMLLAGGLTLGWVRVRIHRSISQHTSDLDREIAGVLGAPRAFLPLAPSLQEDALPHYLEAARLFKLASQDGGFSMKFWIGEGNAQDATHFLSKYGASIVELQRAQRCTWTGAQSPFEKNRWFAYEDNGLLHGVRMFAGALHQELKDDEAFECLFLVLGTLYDLGANSDIQWRRGVRRTERDVVLGEMKRILEAHSLTPANLRRHRRRLDELLGARPSIADLLRSEGITQRQVILRHLSEGETYGWESERSWRFLFSCRMKQVAGLDRIKAASERWQSIRSMPPAEWTASIPSTSGEEELRPFWLASTYRETVEDELRALEELELLRAGMAIAHFEAEKGLPPTSLDALVPDFLPTIPLCPRNGTALLYRDRIAQFDGHWTREWILRPRAR